GEHGLNLALGHRGRHREHDLVAPGNRQRPAARAPRATDLDELVHGAQARVRGRWRARSAQSDTGDQAALPRSKAVSDTGVGVRALGATAAALAAFTALVLAGALTGVDDWAIDHVMPALDPHSHAGIVSGSALW